MGRDTFYLTRLLQAPFDLALNKSYVMWHLGTWFVVALAALHQQLDLMALEGFSSPDDCVTL